MQDHYIVQVIGSRPEKYTFPDQSSQIGLRFFSEYTDSDINGVGTLDFFVNKESPDYKIISEAKLPFYALVYKNKKWKFMSMSEGPKK